MLKITLKKSYIGTMEKQRKILRALGLRKIGMTIIRKEDPSLKGMIHKVSHMLDIEQVKDSQ